MRARLQKFLPLVLLALAMQVLAPIAACWSAGQAVADPLSAAVICHSAGEQGGGLDDRTGTPTAHGAACALCCLAQAGASLDSPPQLALSIPLRHAERVSWHAAEVTLVAADKGSNAQARAPPHLS
ncbi:MULTISPECIES: DUF2946 domain-containing protein [unclassified Bradyrhizobium]|uniref:DUF2946 domain-containing protein n=1 Tax=unclassified Bradyrhizobium TaxID=2631580 RepID=UPI0024B0B8B1|nr:DUF2946 domain-containing protein [Bradyrhizobium sp. CB2312]WFU76754.1 DUF2946 domain-containing protein [Bradyrhizobium sp. CB2312]